MSSDVFEYFIATESEPVPFIGVTRFSADRFYKESSMTHFEKAFSSLFVTLHYVARTFDALERERDRVLYDSRLKALFAEGLRSSVGTLSPLKFFCNTKLSVSHCNIRLSCFSGTVNETDDFA